MTTCPRSPSVAHGRVVNIVARSHARKALEISLCRVSDVRSKTFRTFLRSINKHLGGEEDASGQLTARQPWKDDGKAWHLDADRERDGRKPLWETDLVNWILARAEDFGPLSVKWENRNTVSVTPGDGSDARLPYWMTFRTNDWKHLVMTFRCPKERSTGRGCAARSTCVRTARSRRSPWREAGGAACA